MASTGDKPTAAEASAKAESKEELPPLSDRDFRAFNRMADKMDLFVSSSSLLKYPILQRG
jgi:hypothetical protein